MARYCLFSTALGDCGIAWSDDEVIATHLPDTTSSATASYMRERAKAVPGDPPKAISIAIQAITALLTGERVDLSFIACDFSRVDEFASKVYKITRKIPFGETLTYGDIASQLGDKALSRQVGQMLGRNPFPIIVPCHRVIGVKGKLTGFSAPGGTETKLKMLEIEGAMIGEPQGLFDHLPMAIKPRN